MKIYRLQLTALSVLFSALLMMVVFGCSAQEEQGPQSGNGAEKKTQELRRIHPAFSCTEDDLVTLIHELPRDIQTNIMKKQQYFLELVKQVLDGNPDLFILVDKQHALPADYEPADLTTLTDYPLKLNRTSLRLRRLILPDLLAMNQAALNRGVSLVLSSCYRSYSYQQKVFQRNVAELGDEQARRVSAEPGKSQHQLGTTIDFGSITPEFADTAAGKWLKEHAWEYGFSLSYPEHLEDLTGYTHEIWHYRYIGRKAAELQHDFFQGIQQYMLVFLDKHRETLLEWMGN